jgi:hypothetical protein
MINKLMKRHGYVLVDESKYGAYYEKQEKQGFVHVLCILHKSSGKHILQSYDKNVLAVNGNYINEGCGVEIPVLLLMWIKAKILRIRFKW